MVTQLRLSNNSVERISTLAMHNLNCREQQTPMLLLQLGEALISLRD